MALISILRGISYRLVSTVEERIKTRLKTKFFREWFYDPKKYHWHVLLKDFLKKVHYILLIFSPFLARKYWEILAKIGSIFRTFFSGWLQFIYPKACPPCETDSSRNIGEILARNLSPRASLFCLHLYILKLRLPVAKIGPHMKRPTFTIIIPPFSLSCQKSKRLVFSRLFAMRAEF